MQGALDRRQAILEALSDRRQSTLNALSAEFGVSKRTIRYDIDILSCSAPIFTMQGGGGGIRVADGWYVSRRYLRDDQEDLLRELIDGLQPDKQLLMQNILMAFAKRSEIVKIGKIVSYARNARTHSKEQIAQIRASFREFGVVAPLVVDEKYNLLVGHGRLEAARAEGIEELTCIVVEHLTEAQKRAYIIADNRLALNAGWDTEMLSVEIFDLQGADFDISLLGFDDAEFNKLMGKIEDVKDDDFDVDAELQKPAVTKPGDLWLLGNHRLVCGDSTKAETFDLLMDGKAANLTVTDPPYNVNYEGTAGKIKNDNMADEKFYQFLLDAFTLTEKVMAKDASIYVFHADTEGLNFRRAFAAAGFYLSGTCIWKKQSLVLGRSPYQWRHEPILFGWKKSGKHAWYSDRKQSTVWEFDKPKKNTDHPTMKPVPLIAYPILNSSMTGCIVLDPFGGSGSTLIACEQTDRSCYTIELDEKYCDVIVKRFLEGGGSTDSVFLLRDGIEYKYCDVPENST